jgi:hypothetical protein
VGNGKKGIIWLRTKEKVGENSGKWEKGKYLKD